MAAEEPKPERWSPWVVDTSRLMHPEFARGGYAKLVAMRGYDESGRGNCVMLQLGNHPQTVQIYSSTPGWEHWFEIVWNTRVEGDNMFLPMRRDVWKSWDKAEQLRMRRQMENPHFIGG